MKKKSEMEEKGYREGLRKEKGGERLRVPVRMGDGHGEKSNRELSLFPLSAHFRPWETARE